MLNPFAIFHCVTLCELMTDDCDALYNLPDWEVLPARLWAHVLYQLGQSGHMHLFGKNDYRVNLAKDEIVKALTARQSIVGPLTPSGGQLWEESAGTDWDDCFCIHEIGTTLQVLVSSEVGAERFDERRAWSGALQRKELAQFKPTYWKQITGLKLTYQLMESELTKVRWRSSGPNLIRFAEL